MDHGIYINMEGGGYSFLASDVNVVLLFHAHMHDSILLGCAMISLRCDKMTKHLIGVGSKLKVYVVGRAKELKPRPLTHLLNTRCTNMTNKRKLD